MFVQISRNSYMIAKKKNKNSLPHRDSEIFVDYIEAFWKHFEAFRKNLQKNTPKNSGNLSELREEWEIIETNPNPLATVHYIDSFV